MKPYRVKRSKIDNLGLYASKDIKKGSKVIEYKDKENALLPIGHSKA